MSPIIGGAYRAIVNQYLYQGLYTYSMEYEYGFIYGGLFVLFLIPYSEETYISVIPVYPFFSNIFFKKDFENTYSMEYEYGFIYGGLFVLGYCQFIHKYCTSHKIDKILFLSRDGDILKQVYDQIF